MNVSYETQSVSKILVIGGTGKTGRRVAEGLIKKGAEVRIGSRRNTPSFDWESPENWADSLQGVNKVYVTFYPDLAVPGAPIAIAKFCDIAKAQGVEHIVLLSGRGENEAQRCEDIVRSCGIGWTIVRASWFNQNFSEGPFRDYILGGTIALPVGGVREPFIDADDIAEVVITALCGTGHIGKLYEVTGPRLMTFVEIAQEIERATSRKIDFVEIPLEEFEASLAANHVPNEAIGLLKYLFTEVLDGRNEKLTTGVSDALGRAPKDFTVYAQETAMSGVWNA